MINPERVLNILKDGNTTYGLLSFEKNVFDFINTIRTSPKDVISKMNYIISNDIIEEDIENYYNKDNTNNELVNTENNKGLESEESKESNIRINNKQICIHSRTTHEKIILYNGTKPLEEAIDYLNKKIESGVNYSKLNLDPHLKINFDKYGDKSENILNLSDEKLIQIIKNKRTEIKNVYEKSYFFYNFIEDFEIGLLAILSEDNKISFREILFNQEITQFNVSWTKEKNRGFVCIFGFGIKKKNV